MSTPNEKEIRANDSSERPDDELSQAEMDNVSGGILSWGPDKQSDVFAAGAERQSSESDIAARRGGSDDENEAARL